MINDDQHPTRAKTRRKSRLRALPGGVAHRATGADSSLFLWCADGPGGSSRRTMAMSMVIMFPFTVEVIEQRTSASCAVGKPEAGVLSGTLSEPSGS